MTSKPNLYLSLSKSEITRLGSNGFGLRSQREKVSSTDAQRVHLIRGHVSQESAAAARGAVEGIRYEVRIRAASVENFDRAVVDQAGQIAFTASEPFVLDLYAIEVRVPNVQTGEMVWLPLAYYRLAASDFDALMSARQDDQAPAVTAPAPRMSRAAWFAMMRRKNMLTGFKRAA